MTPLIGSPAEGVTVKAYNGANGVLNAQTLAAQYGGKWRPRAAMRSQRQRKDGRRSWAFGVRFGYWPCLRAPFLRIDLGPVIAEAWVGWPTYLVAGEGRISW